MVPNDIRGFLRLVMVMVACSVANLLCIAAFCQQSKPPYICVKASDTKWYQMIFMDFYALSWSWWLVLLPICSVLLSVLAVRLAAGQEQLEGTCWPSPALGRGSAKSDVGAGRGGV